MIFCNARENAVKSLSANNGNQPRPHTYVDNKDSSITVWRTRYTFTFAALSIPFVRWGFAFTPQESIHTLYSQLFCSQCWSSFCLRDNLWTFYDRQNSDALPYELPFAKSCVRPCVILTLCSLCAFWYCAILLLWFCWKVHLSQKLMRFIVD